MQNSYLRYTVWWLGWGWGGVGEIRHVEEEMKQSEKKQLGCEQAVYRLCAGFLQAETGCV